MNPELVGIYAILSVVLTISLFTLRISITNKSCISRIEGTLNLEARLEDIEDRIIKRLV